jgi:hypothetical protein
LAAIEAMGRRPHWNVEGKTARRWWHRTDSNEVLDMATRGRRHCPRLCDCARRRGSARAPARWPSSLTSPAPCSLRLYDHHGNEQHARLCPVRLGLRFRRGRDKKRAAGFAARTLAGAAASERGDIAHQSLPAREVCQRAKKPFRNNWCFC